MSAVPSLRLWDTSYITINSPEASRTYHPTETSLSDYARPPDATYSSVIDAAKGYRPNSTDHHYYATPYPYDYHYNQTIDLGEEKAVMGIRRGGGGDDNDVGWVTKFKIRYSTTGSTPNTNLTRTAARI